MIETMLGGHPHSLRILQRLSHWTRNFEIFLKINDVDKKGNILLSALLNNVPDSKNSIYAASAFAKSSLLLPQLSIYGTVNHFEKYSTEDLAGDGLRCHALPGATITEILPLWDLKYKANEPVFKKHFTIPDVSSVSTKDAVMVSSFSYSAWSESISEAVPLGPERVGQC